MVVGDTTMGTPAPSVPSKVIEAVEDAISSPAVLAWTRIVLPEAVSMPDERENVTQASLALTCHETGKTQFGLSTRDNFWGTGGESSPEENESSVGLTLRAQGLCKPFRRRQRQDWREYYLGRRHVDALEAAAIAPHVVEHLDDSQLEQHGLPASGRS